MQSAAPEPPAEEKETGKDVCFPVPKGFSTRGKKAGETLQAVAVLEIQEDGTLCLESLNGIPMNAEEAEEAAPAGGGFLDAVESGVASPK